MLCADDCLLFQQRSRRSALLCSFDAPCNQLQLPTQLALATGPHLIACHCTGQPLDRIILFECLQQPYC